MSAQGISAILTMQLVEDLGRRSHLLPKGGPFSALLSSTGCILSQRLLCMLNGCITPNQCTQCPDCLAPVGAREAEGRPGQAGGGGEVCQGGEMLHMVALQLSVS